LIFLLFLRSLAGETGLHLLRKLFKPHHLLFTPSPFRTLSIAPSPYHALSSSHPLNFTPSHLHALSISRQSYSPCLIPKSQLSPQTLEGLNDSSRSFAYKSKIRHQKSEIKNFLMEFAEIPGMLVHEFFCFFYHFPGTDKQW
jgi:hypothetical protein